ncbi:ABC transporter ATP-binding protein [Brevibacterium jeotgali]|uniref:ABC transporter n=1 Tax=Brevibacterium jeotgali TaxID=1262550 RepID=A0A2H1L8R9_9MICO|nr:ATP-binding cassette domain-containing protein [Brevibacterium jeotgali]TWC03230.1 oligopeptide transport system ATP-binding protein [Brevibacterium jeotgali]SMY13286.1 ABC transporter [Brevibacterium jeotgali]
MVTNVLEVDGLSKSFRRGPRFASKRLEPIHAVRDVSFTVPAGRCVGIVGESGSGKSTVARLITRLEDPDNGSIRVGTDDWTSLKSGRLRPLRRNVQMVFQNPYSSLDPTKTVAELIREPLSVHRINPDEGASYLVDSLLDRVGLPLSAKSRHPRDFSGGQRQRIAIARALAPDPKLLIADEAVSALDVSTQAKIVNLFKEILESGETSILFITHDFAVVRQICDSVVVMRRGQVVEDQGVDELFNQPESEYTSELLDSVPRLM